MASEADLDTEIKGLSILSEHPDLYDEFSKMGCVGSLVSLLAHENADIAIDTIQTIGELIDEDVEAEQEQWDKLVHALVRNTSSQFYKPNSNRISAGRRPYRASNPESITAGRIIRCRQSRSISRIGYSASVSSISYSKLMFKGVLENLASQPSVSERIVQDSTVLSWLLSRAQRKESPVSQNKQYAAEILAILLQSSEKNRIQFINIEGVDVLLQLLSQYRKLDPKKDSDEEEYAENLFDCLICLVDEDLGKNKFVEGEGVELAQIMLKEGKFSKQRGLRVLDHALGGLGGVPACERLVEIAGLRTVFGMFMKKVCQGYAGLIQSADPK